MQPRSESQPPLSRSSMTPRPWAGHPLLRLAQRLLGRSPDRSFPLTARSPMLWRRVGLLLLVAAGATFGTDTMVDVLPNHGATWVEQGILVLFGLLFAWISAGFWTAVMGAWVLLRGTDAHALENALPADQRLKGPIHASARTAIIMPICNEDVSTVFAGLRATYESLCASGQSEHFDFFVLSDTNQPELRVAEQTAFAELRQALGLKGTGTNGNDAQSGVFYRWRQHRVHRKAGNVADFCRRWGKSYRYMVVLDADSVMTGDCLTQLVRLMEAHPDAGIIQTAPRASGHSTLHARAQQFGSRVYGPLFTAGMHFWQLGESHYWGHNAILRLEPFITHCALAKIPGNGSMSGDIMSHDFVEAALMRRAGYKVWVAHDLAGSYEQVPPNLITELQRDRRWCSGNLQNSRLMFEPGLHPVHRTVFLTGVVSYLSAPMWLGFLLLSTLLFATQVVDVPQYFRTPYQLFPIWPTSNLKLMLTLFGMTAALLIAPKLISLTVIIIKGQARAYGGALRLLVGAVLEFLYSMLLAPVRMLFHTQFVLAAVFGWKSGWTSPPRGDDATPWSQALQRHGAHVVLTLVWMAAIVYSSETFPLSLSPVFAGLLLAVPLSVWGSRSGIGRALRKVGLLTTPEERDVPPVLRQAEHYAQIAQPSPSFLDAVADPRVQRQAMSAVPARPVATGLKGEAQAVLMARVASDGPAALLPAQRLRLLNDPSAMAALSAAVAVPSAHSQWDGLADDADTTSAQTPAGLRPAARRVGPAALQTRAMLH